MEDTEDSFMKFCQTIARLRAPNGCPWDKRQNNQSLKKYIREESSELLEAMEGHDSSHLCEEIGDVLFLLVLLAEINSESGDFNIQDVVQGINEKMIRRHPHVFAGAPSGDEEYLRQQWKKIKSQEKAKK